MTLPTVAMYPFGPSGRALADDTRNLERRGIRSIWSSEFWDSMVAAGIIGTAAEHSTVGTGFTYPSRPPALLVDGAITLQQLTNNRFQIAIGLARQYRTEGWYGIPWPKRSQRTVDYVRCFRALFAQQPGAPGSYQGEFYQVHDYLHYGGQGTPAPHVWICAAGPLMLKAAGAAGDGVLCTLMMPVDHYWDRARRQVEQGAREAGRDPATIKVAMTRQATVAADRATARHVMRGRLAHSAERDYHQAILRSAGLERELEAILAALARGDEEAARAAVTDEMLDRIALVGTPDDLRDQLKRYEGVDTILIEPGGDASWTVAEHRAQNEALADAFGALSS